MTKTLTENRWFYTENGIERVHWCNVNGVKELVSPKGKVYGYVPDYFEVKRLREQLGKAKKALCEASKMALSNETDISKIYDIVHPVIVYLNGGVK